jgi:predicted kinase
MARQVMDRLLLVAMSGLPGVGKSALSRRIARELELSLFEIDRIEAPLLQRGISGDAIGWGGYEILTALAADNLELGRSVLLDSVCWTRQIRQRWLGLATTYQAAYRPIEVICSDDNLHRRRVELRDRSGDGLPEVDWSRVEEARLRYEAWDMPHLRLDSVGSLEALVSEAIAYVRGD